jgi:hypothetical protein
MPLPKAAFQDDSIAINSGLHNDLRFDDAALIFSSAFVMRIVRQSLGKNFDLFAATTNLKVGRARATVFFSFSNRGSSALQVAVPREKGGHAGPPVKPFKCYGFYFSFFIRMQRFAF